MNLLLLSIGGAVGAMSRYAIGLFISNRFAFSGIPVAMMIVNVLGSLLLGVFLGSYNQAAMPNPADDPYVLLVATGFCGAFTTYSTFSMEALQLLRTKRWKAALLYIAGSLIGSLIACWIGFVL